MIKFLLVKKPTTKNIRIKSILSMPKHVKVQRGFSSSYESLDTNTVAITTAYYRIGEKCQKHLTLIMKKTKF